MSRSRKGQRRIFFLPAGVIVVTIFFAIMLACAEKVRVPATGDEKTENDTTENEAQAVGKSDDAGEKASSNETETANKNTPPPQNENVRDVVLENFRINIEGEPVIAIVDEEAKKVIIPYDLSKMVADSEPTLALTIENIDISPKDATLKTNEISFTKEESGIFAGTITVEKDGSTKEYRAELEVFRNDAPSTTTKLTSFTVGFEDGTTQEITIDPNTDEAEVVVSSVDTVGEVVRIVQHSTEDSAQLLKKTISFSKDVNGNLTGNIVVVAQDGKAQTTYAITIKSGTEESDKEDGVPEDGEKTDTNVPPTSVEQPKTTSSPTLARFAVDFGDGELVQAVVGADKKVSIVQDLSDVPFGTVPSRDYTIREIEVSEGAVARIDGNDISVGQKITTDQTNIEVTVAEATVEYTVEHSVLLSSPSLERTYIGNGVNTIAQATKDRVLVTPLFIVSNVVPNKIFSWKMKSGEREKQGVSAKISDSDGKIVFSRGDVVAFLTASASAITEVQKVQNIRFEFVLFGNASIVDESIVIEYKPTEIWTWQDLQAMRRDMAGKYVQKKDIVFPRIKEGGGPRFFEVIGDYRDQFNGDFLGGNFVIENLSILKNDSYVGIFGFVSNGSITEVRLKNVSIQGNNWYVGGVIGYINSGTVEAKIESGTIKGVKYTGGIVGGSSGIVMGFNKATVEGTDSSAGGLVGETRDSLVFGYNEGSIKTDEHTVGGLVGEMTRGDTYGYNVGRVHAKKGIVGGLVGEASRISNADESAYVKGYNIGAISTLQGNNVGGLVGKATDFKIIGYNKGNVEGLKNVGGLVGEVSRGTVVGYNRGTIRRISGDKGSFGRVIAEIKKKNETIIRGFYSEKNTENGFPNGVVSKSEDYERGITMRDTTTARDFAGFVFGTNKDWTFMKGRWPSVRLPVKVQGKDTAAEQPTEP